MTSLPTYLLRGYVPAHLRTGLVTCLYDNLLLYLPTYLPAFLPTCLHDILLIRRPCEGQRRVRLSSSLLPFPLGPHNLTQSLP